ncbi:MAG: hypothetical protein J6U16_06335 [Ruminococcus sp.]|nr:hypothetical protein [Ruminococcus sp.]
MQGIKKRFAVLLTAAALVPLASCGADNDSENSSVSITAEPETTTETEAPENSSEASAARTGPPEESKEYYLEKLKAFEFSFDDVDMAFDAEGKYMIPPLTDDVPETAAYKETIKTFSRDYENNESNETTVIYYDEYDNELLNMSSMDGGAFEVKKRCEYVYDANGSIILERILWSNLERIARFQYDDSGRETAYEYMDNGVPDKRCYKEYDEYGNTVLECHANYELGETNVLKSPYYLTEKRNIRYDDRGDMLSYDKYMFCHDFPDSSFTMTYDDKGRMLSSEEINAKYDDASGDSYCWKETFEYGADCDQPTLYTETVMDKPDHVDVVSTEERRYDKKGRIVYYKGYNSRHDNVVRIIETEYEELK